MQSIFTMYINNKINIAKLTFTLSRVLCCFLDVVLGDNFSMFVLF